MESLEFRLDKINKECLKYLKRCPGSALIEGGIDRQYCSTLLKVNLNYPKKQLVNGIENQILSASPPMTKYKR